ncbi:armadillo-type protein [Pholiota molesta]|nr:armadillo-type protein [Pholiota molesta]
MFKGILPSRRVPSGDFTIITNLVDSQGKENQPNLPSQPRMPATKGRSVSKGFLTGERKKKTDTKRSKDTPVLDMLDTPISGEAFDKLLLYGMDASVKAAMLKSSQTMAMSPVQDLVTPTTPQTKDSMSSPRHPTLASLVNDNSELPYPGWPLPMFPRIILPTSLLHQENSPHTLVAFPLTALVSFRRAKSTSPLLPIGPYIWKQTTKRKGCSLTKNLSPTKFCSILTSTSSTQLLLRNETASWSEEFLKLGGYAALLTRLNEILEVEWREEQHDDQVLHELLRCFKALSTSSIGCFALRSSCPIPFAQLVTLLYSDKKPGEVATRQLIIELLLVLFDLYPASALPATGHKVSSSTSMLSRPREAWQSQTSLVTSNLITLPAPHKTFFSLFRALLLTPAPPRAEEPAAPISPHAFIESLHQPRIYKNYLQELSDVCRDYFWVFCHPDNTIWILSKTNENNVEKPRAPGGMTGGVEFEAMAYFTTQLKLVNAISKSRHSAYRFHTDLFLSGLERIILISRKASTTYYPTLHLELARYIAYAGRAGYELPYTVARLIGMPPPMTPNRRGDAPALASPRRVESMRFD